MRRILILTIITILSAWTVKDPNIIGTWESKSPKGNTITAVFKADYIYEGYFNKELFSKGTYNFKDSIITFENDKMTACSDTKGSYKLTFLADTAMRFDVINDTCTPRNQGTNGVVYIRSKE